jgi:type II secretion system protein N
MMLKGLTIAGYVSAFIAALGLGLLTGIPDDQVRDYLLYRVNQGTQRLKVSVEDLAISGLGSIRAEGITLDGGRGGPPLTIPSLSLDLHPLRFLTSRQVAVDAEATLPSGAINGASYREDAAGWHLAIPDLSQVGLAPFVRFLTPGEDEDKPLDQRFPVALKGALNGDLSLSGDKALRSLDDLLSATGTVRLNLTGVVLDRLILTMKDQFGNPQSLELRNVHVGSVALEAVADVAGKFEDLKRLPKNQPVIFFRKLEVEGPDLEVIADGAPYIKVRKGKFDLSDLNVAVLVSIRPSLYTREVTIDGKKEKPNEWLKTALDMQPKAKAALNQGFYGVRVTGLVSRPAPATYKPLIQGTLKAKIEQKKEEQKKGAEKKEAASKPEPKKGGRPEATPAVGAGADKAAVEPAQPRPTGHVSPVVPLSQPGEGAVHLQGQPAAGTGPIEYRAVPETPPAEEEQPAGGEGEQPGAEGEEGRKGGGDEGAVKGDEGGDQGDEDQGARKKARKKRPVEADEGEEGGEGGEEGGEGGEEGGDDEGEEGGD